MHFSLASKSRLPQFLNSSPEGLKRAVVDGNSLSRSVLGDIVLDNVTVLEVGVLNVGVLNVGVLNVGTLEVALLEVVEDIGDDAIRDNGGNGRVDMSTILGSAGKIVPIADLDNTGVSDGIDIGPGPRDSIDKT
jgi:hypothetical protein